MFVSVCVISLCVSKLSHYATAGGTYRPLCKVPQPDSFRRGINRAWMRQLVEEITPMSPQKVKKKKERKEREDQHFPLP